MHCEDIDHQERGRDLTDLTQLDPQRSCAHTTASGRKPGDRRQSCESTCHVATLEYIPPALLCFISKYDSVGDGHGANFTHWIPVNYCVLKGAACNSDYVGLH
jgi:hypothetical protein